MITTPNAAEPDAGFVADVRGLKKSFKKKSVLRGATFKLRPGEVHGLVGRNGTGKTTLLSILSGQIRPDGAEGLEVLGARPFDNPMVMDRTVFCGVDTAFPALWQLRSILDVAARRWGNWDQDTSERLVAEFELDTTVKYSAASRGQRSMLAIVVALAARCELTLLDEPYLGLDAHNREIFYRELLRAQVEHPRTIVLATHDLADSARVIERFLVLSRAGTIAEWDAGTLDDALVAVPGTTAQGSIPTGIALRTDVAAGQARTILYRSDAEAHGLRGQPVPMGEALALLMEEGHDHAA